jgi:hypothetical protein
LTRVLALLFALISLPAFAADYSPWPGNDDGACAVDLAQAPGAQTPGAQTPVQILPNGGTGEGTQKKPEVRAPGDYCCVHCRWNETPCGSTCLSKTAKGPNGKPLVCMATRGCACPGKP